MASVGQELGASSAATLPLKSASDVQSRCVGYQDACDLALAGRLAESRTAYDALLGASEHSGTRPLIENDLAVLDALGGDLASARDRLLRVVEADSRFAAGLENLSLVESELETALPPIDSVGNSITESNSNQQIKVAIVSLLFNWPSTGGGTIHTAETGQFLQRAGYDVRHIYVQFEPWGLGQVVTPLAVPSEALRFEIPDWNASEIQRRVRKAVDAYGPDFVIITDSWNFKPLLAEAVKGYRYFLRLAAQECLCPLNNVRLLINEDGAISACPRHQLATPDDCRRCVRHRNRLSGGLHQAERELSGFELTDYPSKLRQAFVSAEAVLVVNPLIAAMVGPYAKAVRVVPSGFDANRFPWPETDDVDCKAGRRERMRLLFAGLTQEFMKGFHILCEACQQLWQRRRDFELVVTGDAPEHPEEFCQYIGWQTQERLPHEIRAADVLVFPTIAEEALGRSAVEAMGAGRPVIASRIGGLQFTVIDGATGLLFEPGDASDLARQISVLLDHPELRQQFGKAGRKRFEEHHTWDAIIARHYRPLFETKVKSTVS